ncbi:hypothetical protein Q5P01_005234 [Channa striata]|uniref:Uncharacterized protein n=1 Tax=Channa striata TaxID=64152 RepID=A0AA88NCG9_CHASR|nr:hypothetical protein Q5P01_005234 [Channa striata]
MLSGLPRVESLLLSAPLSQQQDGVRRQMGPNKVKVRNNKGAGSIEGVERARREADHEQDRLSDRARNNFLLNPSKTGNPHCIPG